MRFLISLVAIFSHSQVENEIKEIAEKYFHSSESITIISDNISSWNFTPFTKPVKMLELDKGVIDSHIPPAVIFHQTKVSIHNFTRGIKWDAHTKFLIVTKNNCSSRTVFELWDIQVCRVIILSMKSGKIQVCKNLEPHCYNEEPNVITEQYEIHTNLKDYYITPELNGCTVNMTYMDLPPNTILKDGAMSGTEGMIINYTAKELGLNMEFINRGESNFGTYVPPKGLVGDIYLEKSFGGFGNLYPLVERNEKTDMIVSCIPTALSFTAPLAAGPRHPTSFVILVSEFSPAVWAGVFVAYCALIPIHAIFSRLSKQEQPKVQRVYWPFYILSLTLGIPEKERQGRIMMLTCIFYGFFLSSVYKTMMSSKLTAPEKVPEVRTLQELADTDFTIKGPYTIGVITRTLAKGGSSDAPLKKLGDRYISTFENATDIFQQMIKGRNIAFARHTQNMIYISLSHPDTAGKVHFVEEPITRYLAVHLLKKNSCFSNKWQQFGIRVCETGIPSKMVKDASESREYVSDNGLRKLTIADVRGFLYLVSFGWFVSFFVFLLELKMSKYKRGQAIPIIIVG